MKKLLPIFVLTLAIMPPAFSAEAQRPSGIDSGGLASEQLQSARRLQRAGQYGAARAVLLKALAVTPESWPLLDALGSVEQDRGEYLEAERSYLRALAASRRIGGGLDQLVILSNLGTLYLETAQYAKGDRVREQLQKLSPTILELDPRATAILLSVIGSLERARNRNDEAERYYLRSLHLFQQANGSVNLDAAIMKNNLGNLKLDAGQYESASDFFQQAIREIEIVSGPENPTLIRPLVNLAICENAVRRPNRAEPLARRAVELSARTFGERHPMTARAMLEQAAALRRLGRKRLARNLEKRAKAGLRTNSTINAAGYTVSLRELAREKMH